MLVDIVNQVISSQALASQSTAGTPSGSAKDFSNGKVSTGALVNVGANSGTIAGQIEESADGATGWAAISGMTFSISSANQLVALRGQRTHRYLRANITANNGTALIGITVLAEKQLSGSGGGYSRSPST